MSRPAEQPQKLLLILAGAFAVFTVLVTIVFFSWWAMRERLSFGDQPFDPVRWMAPIDTAHPCTRGDMVRDVKQRLLHRGMSKTEIMVLLGRPAWEDEAQIEYDLGFCHGDVHGLRLYFDQQERLVHSAIAQH